MIRVYLDACAVIRLLDDQLQARVHAEALAIEQVFEGIAAQKVIWVASTPLRLELGRNRDADQRVLTSRLLTFAGEVFDPGPRTYERSLEFEAVGLDTYDALHLACAEESMCSALLTTDDRFIRRAARLPAMSTKVFPENPVDWAERSVSWR